MSKFDSKISTEISMISTLDVNVLVRCSICTKRNKQFLNDWQKIITCQVSLEKMRRKKEFYKF